MFRPSRREALTDIGRGMFLATLGTGVATDLGLGAAWADEGPGRLIASTEALSAGLRGAG